MTDRRTAYWSVPHSERCWHHDCDQQRAGERWCPEHERTRWQAVERARTWLRSLGYDA